jgi:hypothetical protein
MLKVPGTNPAESSVSSLLHVDGMLLLQVLAALPGLCTFPLTLSIDLRGERTTMPRSASITSSLPTRILGNVGPNPGPGRQSGDLLLPLESEPVYNEDLRSEQEAGDLAIVESHTQKVQGAAPVHRGTSNIEWEAGDGSIHEDAEIVSEVGSGDAEGIHARQNEDRSDAEQDGA